VIRRKTFNQRHSDRGGGCSTPLPVEPPPPRGRYPIDALPREETTTSRSHLTPPEDPVSVPRARLSGAIVMHCPPPLEGAGGGRGSGRAVGVVDCLHGKTSSVRHRRQGMGLFHLPPRQPLPTGRFSHRHSATGGDHYFAVSPDTP